MPATISGTSWTGRRGVSPENKANWGVGVLGVRAAGRHARSCPGWERYCLAMFHDYVLVPSTLRLSKIVYQELKRARTRALAVPPSGGMECAPLRAHSQVSWSIRPCGAGVSPAFPRAGGDACTTKVVQVVSRRAAIDRLKAGLRAPWAMLEFRRARGIMPPMKAVMLEIEPGIL